MSNEEIESDCVIIRPTRGFSLFENRALIDAPRHFWIEGKFLLTTEVTTKREPESDPALALESFMRAHARAFYVGRKGYDLLAFWSENVGFFGFREINGGTHREMVRNNFTEEFPDGTAVAAAGIHKFASVDKLLVGVRYTE